MVRKLPRSRVTQQQSQKLPVSLRELCNDRERFKVDPAFQREDVWPIRMSQALIDSILLGKTIAPLTGYSVTDEDTGQRTYVISNGHQRTAAILGFKDGLFKTWTPGAKNKYEPNSKPPVEPGRHFDELTVIAKNNFLDYRLEISLEKYESDTEITVDFLRINNQIPLTAAERLNAYKSKAKTAANRIEEHPFWEEFYTGAIHRKQLFQNGLQLLALELSSPIGITDLQSSVYFQGLAAGNSDKNVTEAVVDTILRRLTVMTSIFHGAQFSKRATMVPMYQSVMFLEREGYTFQPKDKGRLSKWISAIIADSNRPSGVPIYNQPVQKLLRESAQKAFWDRNYRTIMGFFGINSAA